MGNSERRSFRVTVERNRLRFAAAHFTTAGDECEPLHGHNYDVFAEVKGEVTEDGWVIDFVKLKDIMAGLCKELDHRFLLAMEARHLEIKEVGDSYEIHAPGRRYVIPKSDVVPLPIDNSTAERIAEWICNCLVDKLRAMDGHCVESVTVGVGGGAWTGGLVQLGGYVQLTTVLHAISYVTSSSFTIHSARCKSIGSGQ